MNNRNIIIDNISKIIIIISVFSFSVLQGATRRIDSYSDIVNGSLSSIYGLEQREAWCQFISYSIFYEVYPENQDAVFEGWNDKETGWYKIKFRDPRKMGCEETLKYSAYGCGMAWHFLFSSSITLEEIKRTKIARHLETAEERLALLNSIIARLESSGAITIFQDEVERIYSLVNDLEVPEQKSILPNHPARYFKVDIHNNSAHAPYLYIRDCFNPHTFCLFSTPGDVGVIPWNISNAQLSKKQGVVFHSFRGEETVDRTSTYEWLWHWIYGKNKDRMPISYLIRLY